ncbi:MAG: prolyl oligopeptidase family serine peptidase [Bacteroidales bacterium]|nr:prolyl oligopeptidase family serine peptidase [Bacteroidales bacterium]
MKGLLCSAIFLTMFVYELKAQRVPLDHSVYDTWKSIGSVTMSQDGRFTLTVVNAQASDGYLLQSNLTNGTSFVIDRGRTPAITFDSRFAVSAIAPFFEQTRQARIQRKRPDQMPKDTLVVWTLGRPELIKYPYLRNFEMAEEGSLAVAFMTDPPVGTSEGGGTPPRREREEGRDLMLHYFATGQVDTIRFVSQFAFTRNGTELFFVRKLNSNDTSEVLDGLFLYDLRNRTERAILTGPRGSRFMLPASDADERFFAFYANTDTSADVKNAINIYFFERGAAAVRVVDAAIAGLPQGYIISENRTLALSKEGTRLFFGIAPRPLERDTTLVDFETAVLDIWHYMDDFVQPRQLVTLRRDLARSYLSFVDPRLPQNGLVRLATPEYPNVTVPNRWSSDWAFSVSDVPYRIQTQWNADAPEDLYIIDVATGKPRMLITAGTLTGVHASPEGRFLVWFDRTARHWFSYELATQTMRNLTEGINVAFWDEVHDRPQLPPPYGSGGWRENDAVIFLSDRYDIWEVDPSGRNAPFMLTDGVGRANRYSFCILHLRKNETIASHRGRWWSPPADPIRDGETIHFTAFDNVNKYNGFFLKEQGRRRTPMQRLVLDGHNYQHLRVSNDGRTYTFVRSNFSESPNLWTTRNRFRTQTQLSDINPQQENYLWGTAQLVSWACPNGRPHDGILFKPENFDPNKKYPMIVFFYERRSYQLFFYREPAPSRSTINISYFVSNGYIVFLPDTYYDLGFPGQSAYNSIMSGVDMLIENPWIDQNNIGIQGQSWAGYKIAWLITRTDRFRAAMAGAPVSNMTSAYGTIRWATGIVRQFQYEGTQSRIGQNLWDALDLYIENSPLFFLPNVNTPLLIMHNDGDGAVPWEEGIQLFTGLRRLGKPVWLLNYNGEAHNLRERRNQKDLSIRLSQFFDHFLRGAPAPVWIERGVPATLKGIDWGFGFE